MKKIICAIALLAGCLGLQAQQHSGIVTALRQTLDDFSADMSSALENKDDTEVFRKYLEDMSDTYGGNGYFLWNNTSHLSIGEWFVTYADEKLAGQNFFHEFRIMERTVRKVEEENPKDLRYAAKVSLVREYGGKKDVEEISVIFKWEGQEYDVKILELRGDFNIENLNGIITESLKTQYSDEYQLILPFKDGVSVVSRDGKFGCIDGQGNIVVEPVFDSIGTFSEGKAIAVKDGKMGYVSKTGTIPCTFDKAQDFKNGRAPVEVNGKWGCINVNGQYTIPPQYDELRVKGDVVCVRKEKLWGVKSLNGDEILPVKFNSVTWLGENRITTTLDEERQLWSVSGTNIPLKRNYENIQEFIGNVALVERTDEIYVEKKTPLSNSRYGIIDRDGNEILEPVQDKVRIFAGHPSVVISSWQQVSGGWMEKKALFSLDLNKFVTGFDYWKLETYVGMEGLWIAATTYDKNGVINDKGQTVIPLKYENEIRPFDGLLQTYHKGKTYQFNRKGEIILETEKSPTMLVEEERHGILGKRIGGKIQYALLDKAGNILTPFSYSTIKRTLDSMAVVSDKNVQGLLDKDGYEILKPEYDAVTVIKKNVYAVKKDGLWSIINSAGNPVISDKFQNVEPKDHFVLIRRNMLWGIMSNDGKISKEPVYDGYNDRLGEGNIAVIRKNRWGVVNKEGVETVAPQYERLWKDDNNQYWLVHQRLWSHIGPDGQITRVVECDEVIEYKDGEVKVKNAGHIYILTKNQEWIRTNEKITPRREENRRKLYRRQIHLYNQ